MSEFFNKKEEMLQIELTEHGKYMFSQGLLKPAYYCFYDDEILYDGRAAPGGDASTPAEKQNDVDRRIRYQTPNIKVSPNIIGAERRQAEFESFLPLSALGSAGYFSPTVSHTSITPQYNTLIQQNFVAKYNLAADPIGTSALNTNYDAAWQLSILPEDRAKIDSSNTYELINLTSSQVNGLGDGFVKEIPQLNITIDYKTFYRQGAAYISEALVDEPLNENAIYLALRKNYLLLQIEEENTDDLKENFDIEVYYVSSSTSTSTPSNQLTQKIFVDSNPYGGGGPPANIDIDPSHVEYYMNIYVDNEIPVSAFVQAGIQLEDLLYQGGNVRYTNNLYHTPSTEPCD